MLQGVPPVVWRCPECGFEADGGPGTRCGQDGRALVPRDTLEDYPDDPLLGHVLAGQYALIDVLGSGGMGAVYHGIQAPSGREVAVKTILPPGGRRVADPALRERFFQEARVLAELKSPRIVRLFDFGEDEGGRLYMVQELVRGESLDAVLWRRRRLPTELAVGVAARVLEALSEPHAHGLVHRDIKPGNVMIGVVAGSSPLDDDALPQVTLIDFGLVKALFGDETADGPRAPVTRTGMAVGTPRFMAPEQLGRGVVGPWTDQYAVGVLLFQMLVGETPFEGTTAEIIAGHLKDPVPPMPAHVAVPPAIEQVVRRMLDKRPERRFADGAEVIAALEAALDRSGDPAVEAPATRVQETRRTQSIPPERAAEVAARPEAPRRRSSPPEAATPRRTKALNAEAVGRAFQAAAVEDGVTPGRSGLTRVLRAGAPPREGATQALPPELVPAPGRPVNADPDALPPTLIHGEPRGAGEAPPATLAEVPPGAQPSPGAPGPADAAGDLPLLPTAPGRGPETDAEALPLRPTVVTEARAEPAWRGRPAEARVEPAGRARADEPTVPVPRRARTGALSWRTAVLALVLATVTATSTWAVARWLRRPPPPPVAKPVVLPPADAVTAASGQEPPGGWPAPAPASTAAPASGDDAVPPDEAHLHVAARAGRRRVVVEGPGKTPESETGRPARPPGSGVRAPASEGKPREAKRPEPLIQLVPPRRDLGPP